MKGVMVYSLEELPHPYHGPHAEYTVLSANDDFNRALLQRLHPGIPSKPHRHYSPEVFFVLEGELTIVGDDEEVVVPAGYICYVDSNVLHGVRNDGEQDTVLIILLYINF